MKGFVFILSAFLVLCSCQKKEQEKPAEKRVNVAIAEPAEESSEYTASGRIKAAEEMQIAFRVSGTIKRVTVTEGQRVHRGQLLAVMDDRDYSRQLAAAEAEYASIKAEAERVMQLYAEEATTADNYDKARYGLEQITTKLQHCRDQVNDTRLYAPIDGYVQDIIFKEDETVGAGMAVLSIVGSGAVQAEVSLPSKIAAREKQFERIDCYVESSGETYSVTLAGIKRKATAGQTYTATFNLPSGAQALIGASCSVSIHFRDNNPGEDATAIVPAKAVMGGEDNESWVFLCHEGTIEQRNVKIARIDRGGRAYILSGIEPGDTIVVSGIHHLRPGEKVTPMLRETSDTNKGGLL